MKRHGADAEWKDRIWQSSFISFAPNNETEWSAAPFLTSEYNNTAKVASNYNSVSNQSFAISHTCKTPELAMRFVDWWFDYDNYHLAIFGPTAEQEDLFLGKIDSGWTYATDDEDDATKVYPAVEDGSYPTAGEYHYAKIQGIIGGYVASAMTCLKTVSIAVRLRATLAVSRIS